MPSGCDTEGDRQASLCSLVQGDNDPCPVLSHPRWSRGSREIRCVTLEVLSRLEGMRIIATRLSGGQTPGQE